MSTFFQDRFTELLIVNDSGGTEVSNRLIYEVPAGFHTELCDLQFRGDFGGSSFMYVQVLKRFTSISDTREIGRFSITRTNFPSPTPSSTTPVLLEIYGENNVDNLGDYKDFFKKSGNGLFLYTGDELRLTNSLVGAEDWEVRLTLKVYTNP